MILQSPGIKFLLLMSDGNREQIAASVAGDLNARLKAIEEGNPFEARAWSSAKTVSISPTEFDLLDVPPYVDHDDPNSVRAAKAVLTGNPFSA